MLKSEARQLFRDRRRALTEAGWATASDAIQERFFTWFSGVDLPPGPVIHTFLPIARQKEVDTWPIVRRLWQDFSQITLVAPVTDRSSGEMTNYALRPDTPVVAGAYGIPEPTGAGRPVSASAIDLVLVPLLAFDLRGHRVGYGGGFYDRFLARCRPDCLKVGLSLFEPIEVIQDVFEGDVRLNYCLTPDQTYCFPISAG